MHTFTETGAGVPAFLAKLWRLVEDPETNDLISWSSDGRSFIIQNQAQFAKELLPLNYKHNNMASFIRQLNMYGFHKITSIDNGGLRFDKDEMEFTHPCFQKDHPYLLEHIKRKIATSKQQQQQQDDKGGLKVEAMNRVLTEMKQMRGRQESLDTRFSSMKQENEALWREIAILRQKHLKQQQIVNKLIQFLVTIVQPSRSGLGSMGNGNNKRRFQLMINDAPQSKQKKTEGGEGASIQELGEALEAYENEQELLASEIPEVMSPISLTQQSPYHSGSPNEIIEEAQYSPQFGTGNIKQETFDFSSGVADNCEQIVSDAVEDDHIDGEYADEAYLVDHVDEINPSNMQFFDDSDMLHTPMVIKEMQKQEQLKQQQQQPMIQQQQQQQKAANKGESLLKNRKNMLPNKDQKSLLNSNKTAFSVIPNTSMDKSGKKMISPGKQVPAKTAVNINAGPSGTNNFVPTVKPSTSSMAYGVEDFNVGEVPADIFDDDSNVQKESPMLGGFNFESGFYNPNVNISQMKGKQLLQPAQPQLQQQQQQNLQPNVSNQAAGTDEHDESSNPGVVSKFVSNNADLNRLNSLADYGQHIDTVQTDLDSLKDLLKGDNYQFDANTLLGAAGGNGPQYGRVYFAPTSFDTDALNKLFNSNEDIMGMDFPMNLPDLAESQRKAAVDGTIAAPVTNNNDTNNGTGHVSPSPNGGSSNQLMTYKTGLGNHNACDYIDLNELLNLDGSNEGQSTLN
ncbi:heat shock factor protein isoform X3 [Aedes albopictus]|uniref:HSF-type DNA-binding domain-containing protein n=1 Tax=Aedes albopictus TaxID=7160 RepID=A0ABM1XQZ5_AEDAL|nr:heat shock factor protein-like isoform X3 [Aedes albopictus]XP_029720473.1 heat shock factor protein-like isoform X3 [Aedes albopictus]